MSRNEIDIESVLGVGFTRIAKIGWEAHPEISQRLVEQRRQNLLQTSDSVG